MKCGGFGRPYGTGVLFAFSLQGSVRHGGLHPGLFSDVPLRELASGPIIVDLDDPRAGATDSSGDLEIRELERQVSLLNLEILRQIFRLTSLTMTGAK